MKTTRRILTLTLIGLLASSLAFAGERWLHVRVHDDDPDGERVSVNIPLQLVEAVLPTIQTEELNHGRVHWGHHPDLAGIDLHEMLKALRDAPDAEFVTVRGRSESVRVAKRAGFLLVHADDDSGDRVRVRMPLRVVEAMLAAGEDQLDLIAGLRALAEFDGEDLITVESRDGFVRVWIDSSESGE